MKVLVENRAQPITRRAAGGLRSAHDDRCRWTKHRHRRKQVVWQFAALTNKAFASGNCIKRFRYEIGGSVISAQQRFALSSNQQKTEWSRAVARPDAFTVRAREIA